MKRLILVLLLSGCSATTAGEPKTIFKADEFEVTEESENLRVTYRHPQCVVASAEMKSVEFTHHSEAQKEVSIVGVIVGVLGIITRLIAN